MSKTDLAFWLGLYASAVASVTALWALFRELWVDRARLDVSAEEVWLVPVKGQPRPLVVRGEDTLRTMGVTESQRTPILELSVRNRGRRDATITQLAQGRKGGSSVFADVLPRVPFAMPVEQTFTLPIGQSGGYKHGDIRPKRFFVVDGASRVHPLREQYRQRLGRGLRRPKLPPALGA